LFGEYKASSNIGKHAVRLNVSKFIKSACNEERYAKIISKRKELERQRACYRDDTVDGDIGNRL